MIGRKLNYKPNLWKFPSMTKGHKINQWHGEFKTVRRFLRVLRVKGIPVTEAFQTQTKIQLLLVTYKTQKYAV